MTSVRISVDPNYSDCWVRCEPVSRDHGQTSGPRSPPHHPPPSTSHSSQSGGETQPALDCQSGGRKLIIINLLPVRARLLMMCIALIRPETRNHLHAQNRITLVSKGWQQSSAPTIRIFTSTLEVGKPIKLLGCNQTNP